MLSPSLELAFNIANKPKAYALLLGSGLSRSAGIMTGWEIVLDLIGQLACHENVLIKHSEHEAWYLEKFNKKEASYSEIIEMLARTPLERKALLRNYFEPTEDEKEKGLKQPTSAHKAIARLVADGFIKIIITTNFDHLIEQALAELHIQPVIIKSPSDIEGSLPLHLEKCVIVKVHGDYLDHRFKNTDSELKTYSVKIKSLLKRIFEEYGLIVAGWSAKWDFALRDCITRSLSQRFTSYWLMRGPLEAEAQQLISTKHGVSIAIESAEIFFPELYDQISAIKSYHTNHPISKQAAITVFKKRLREKDNIAIQDLIKKQVDITLISLREIWHDDESHVPSLKKIKQYENAIEVLANFLLLGAYWADGSLDSIWLGVLSDLCAPDIRTYKPDRGFVKMLALRRYPIWLLFYTVGFAAIQASKGPLLAKLFSQRIKTPDIEANNNYTRVTLLSYLYGNDTSAIIWHVIRELDNEDTFSFPNKIYFNFIKNLAIEHFVTQNNVEFTFTLMDYFICLKLFLAWEDGNGKMFYNGFFWRKDPFFLEEVGILMDETSWFPLEGNLFESRLAFANTHNTYRRHLYKNFPFAQELPLFELK